MVNWLKVGSKARACAVLRLLVAIGAVLFVAGAAAGCGGGSSQGGGTQAPTTGGQRTEGGGGGQLGSLNVVVGTAGTYDFLPADLGMKLGVWKKRGLTVKNLSATGSGQVAQTLASGSTDIGLTAGLSGVAPIVKGLAAKYVAGLSTSFAAMDVVVADDSPIKKMSDLKGKTIGITSPGSLTDYLAGLLGDVKKAPLGGLNEQLAALQNGTTDAFIWTTEASFTLEEKHQGRLLGNFGDIVKNNVFEAIIANDKVISERSKAVQAYIDGWFETVQYMKSHKAETVAFMAKDFGLTKSVAARVYDAETPRLLSDGVIPDANLRGLSESAVKAGAATSAPAVDSFWTGQFVPAQPGRTTY